MKKIFVILLTVIMLLVFAGCNFHPVDMHWGFNYAYIYQPNGSIVEIEIETWTEDENSVTIVAKDGQVFSVGYHNCVLTKERWNY